MIFLDTISLNFFDIDYLAWFQVKKGIFTLV